MQGLVRTSDFEHHDDHSEHRQKRRAASRRRKRCSNGRVTASEATCIAWVWVLLLFVVLPTARAFVTTSHSSGLQEPYHDGSFHSRPSSSLSAAESSSGDDSETTQLLKQQLEQQQKQLDMLVKVVQQQQTQPATSSKAETPAPKTRASPAPSPGHTTLQPESSSSTPLVLAPQKVMLFIDGTWLYYSIHERIRNACPIIQRYGLGWQRRYEIDWAALPRIICKAIQDPAWTENLRPLEIVRATVFTSFKADTSPTSLRYQMFQQLKAANYDVHMMETVGKSEKCVDIQLAVEMLHYATVPHAYDIALLVTGDKDFMPAMIRTRQKGRKVGLVSMKRGCNRALYETDGVKDYNVIWLEDHLDELIIPKAGMLPSTPTESLYSSQFFVKIVHDFVAQSGIPKVSSRDLGRYLKFLQLPGGSRVLDELKLLYGGGLTQFMQNHEHVFAIQQRHENALKQDKSDRAYWISLKPSATELNMDDQDNDWTESEQLFWGKYTTDILRDQRNVAFFHSLLMYENEGSTETTHESMQLQQTLPDELTRDYSQCSVKQLKEECRQRGLPVSGVKAVLLERVQKHVQEQVAQFQQQQVKPKILSMRTVSASQESSQYLKDLVMEYVQARGGSAGSRDVGRYLVANKSSTSDDNVTALQELKYGFGSLVTFVLHHSDTFVKRDISVLDSGSHEFQIALRSKR